LRKEKTKKKRKIDDDGCKSNEVWNKDVAVRVDVWKWFQKRGDGKENETTSFTPFL